MLIGERLRTIREAKNLSQGDIEKRTGLLRCYVSRVENGYTVPNLVTLEKFASALAVPLWKLFHDGAGGPRPMLPANVRDASSAESAIERTFLGKLFRLSSRLSERDRSLLLYSARAMARRRR